MCWPIFFLVTQTAILALISSATQDCRILKKVNFIFRQVSLDMQKETAQRQQEEEAWYRQQKLLLDAEDKRRRMIQEEEQKLTDQRKK